MPPHINEKPPQKRGLTGAPLTTQRQLGNEAVVSLRGKNQPRTQGPRSRLISNFFFDVALLMMTSPLFLCFNVYYFTINSLQSAVCTPQMSFTGKSYVREMFTRSWPESNDPFPYLYPAPFVGGDAHRLEARVQISHPPGKQRSFKNARGSLRGCWSFDLTGSLHWIGF